MRRNSPTVYGKKTGLFHPYKPCGLTSCVTSWTLARRDLYLSPLNEMKFSDCMIENGLFHPYKLYGSTSHIIPLTPVPFMRCSFPTVYGFKTVYHCLSNRTDRKVVFLTISDCVYWTTLRVWHVRKSAKSVHLSQDICP